MKKDVYQIFSGNTDDEFYTFETPVIEIDKVVCKKLIQKGVIWENVMDEKIEEFYKLDIIPDEQLKKESKYFDLNLGFVIKLLPTETLPWLERTEDMAFVLLKDKVLDYYKTLLPKLIGDVRMLQQQLNGQEFQTPIPIKRNLLIS